jgi:Acetyltransferase (GNAT) domain
MLADLARPLLSRFPATQGPRFFMASLTPNQWTPNVMVVRQGTAIVGLVYMKERKICGFRTGVVFSDATLGYSMVCEPDQRGEVLEAALRSLLGAKHIRGVRLMAPSEGVELPAAQTAAAAAKAEICYGPLRYHWLIPLAFPYEAFVDKLSYKARRNLRTARKRVEAAGHHYVEHLDFAEFETAAYELLKRSVVGGDREGVERALRVFSEIEGPIFVGLRHHNGELMAILGGWHGPDHPIVFFQMNNERDYRTASLSQVLRAYLIEDLISQGHRGLLFWAGLAGPLARISRPLDCASIYLDNPSRGWAALRSLCRMLAPHLPPRLRWMADWINLPESTPCAPDLSALS